MSASEGTPSVSSGKQAQALAEPQLLQDRKFRWLLFSVVTVLALEILSLAGLSLPSAVALPVFLAFILAVGHRTIRQGVLALRRLDFRSIKLLMVVAVVGAFYLGEYEEAAVVIVLFTLGEELEEFGVQKSKSALRTLVERTPKTVARKGEETEVSIDSISVGDVVVIKPSDMVALDGVVASGASSVDESTITGEPLPKDKSPGDGVFAGTLNLTGYLEVRVTKGAADSTLAKILELTFGATSQKAETQKFIETFSRYYTPSVMLLALGLTTIPVLLGAPFEPWFREALTLLVIACPCALVISTPISIYSAIGNASARGVIIKGGRYVEALGQLRAVAMDKTRTLTYGRPRVTDVIPGDNTTKEQLLSCAAGIESYSEHPLAQSIVGAAQAANLEIHLAENFRAVLGKGATAECTVCHGRDHLIGKLPFILEQHPVPEEVLQQVEALQRQGKTSIVVSSGGVVEGVIAMVDELKPESKQAVAELIQLGIHCVMLTGDHRTPAMAVATEVGIEDVRAELLPQDKAAAITELVAIHRSVGMVGDGVNDAPALALAAVGISMGAAGSDTAIEASSIAILNDRLETIPFLVRLGRATIATIKLNTSLAVVTKATFIALALAGWSNLALAIFADVGVTIVVILNSLRLLRFDSPELKQARATAH
jgi:Cd2+/Zn2+-exporting ATPase